MKISIPIKNNTGVLPNPESKAIVREMMKQPIIVRRTEYTLNPMEIPQKNRRPPTINLMRLNIMGL
jgi:hypothetical protein